MTTTSASKIGKSVGISALHRVYQELKFRRLVIGILKIFDKFSVIFFLWTSSLGDYEEAEFVRPSKNLGTYKGWDCDCVKRRIKKKYFLGCLRIF